MLYRQAKFICSAPKLKFCPDDNGREIAFAGRSNAGKSSAINAITGNNKLARVSKTPGRTQAINFFAIDDQRRLVDLPGYGFAKVPESVKQQWHNTLETYFSNRSSLKGVVLIMDIRHPLKPFDQMMINWSEHYNMPLHILLTKADKLTRNATNKTVMQVVKSINSNRVSVQAFSVATDIGLNSVYKVLNNWLGLLDNPK